MNDSELNELLRRARMPERRAQKWKELTDETMRQVARSTIAAAPLRHQSGLGALVRTLCFAHRRWIWTGGFTTACLLVGLFIGYWHARYAQERSEIAEARKLFVELNAMFPSQLEAIVINGGTPKLVLSEKPSPNKGAPLFVRVCKAKRCEMIITFSGERVSVNGQNCDVFVNAEGRIIVAGEHFVWTSGEEKLRNSGYQIEAAPLTGTL